MAVKAPTQINGIKIGPIAFGMMSLTRQWAPMDYDEAVKVMKAALESGANLWNAGTFYGTKEANSLHLLNHYFTLYPEDADKVLLNLKGAFEFPPKVLGSPEGLRKSVNEALAVLAGTKKIDVFEMARVDPDVDIEISIAALGELVKEGKIGGIGLSELSAESIRRAAKVHEIACVEVELSVFSTDILTNGIKDTCEEFNISILAYSPLSNGFITGKIKSIDDLDENDYRRHQPRFQPEVFGENLKLVHALEEIAKKKNKTVAQVAIAWVAQQGTIPLPGSNTVERVKENSELITLDDGELKEVAEILKKFVVKGERYPAALLAMTR